MSEFSKGFKSRRPDKSFYDPAFASGWWVYGTLILSWCLDLLPLSRLPYFPSFLILTLVFWTIHQPQRIYYWLAFAFGLLFRKRFRTMVYFCPRFAECRDLAGLVLAPRAPMGS